MKQLTLKLKDGAEIVISNNRDFTEESLAKVGTLLVEQRNLFSMLQGQVHWVELEKLKTELSLEEDIKFEVGLLEESNQLCKKATDAMLGVDPAKRGTERSAKAPIETQRHSDPDDYLYPEKL